MDELWHNRQELLCDWWWERWCGERTQTGVVESLQKSLQTTICPSCLLLDMGLGWVGVDVPHVRFSVSLDERRREREDRISWLLVCERNARVLPSFSCRSRFSWSVFAGFPAEAGFHDQFLPIVLLKRKIAITFAALWCDRWECQGLEGCLWLLGE